METWGFQRWGSGREEGAGTLQLHLLHQQGGHSSLLMTLRGKAKLLGEKVQTLAFSHPPKFSLFCPVFQEFCLHWQQNDPMSPTALPSSFPRGRKMGSGHRFPCKGLLAQMLRSSSPYTNPTTSRPNRLLIFPCLPLPSPRLLSQEPSRCFPSTCLP